MYDTKNVDREIGGMKPQMSEDFFFKRRGMIKIPFA